MIRKLNGKIDVMKCYSIFHHSRWITLCMAFPYPAANSLAPMDHFLSFDVSLIIPKNTWKMLYATFKPTSAYIPLKPRTSGCVHNPNPFGFFLDIDLTHLTLGLPYALRLLGFDLSLPLWKLYEEPLGTLKGGRENWEQRNYSPLFPELMLESASLCPLEH